MDIKSFSLKDIVVGIIIIGMVCGVGYLGYGVFFGSEDAGGQPTINAGLLGPKLQKAALTINGAKEKISVKPRDYAFVESALYKSFVDPPEVVPLSDSRGRPDPFVPYASP